MGIPLQTAEFFEFSGGMNDRSSDTSLRENEWGFLRNVEFTKDGSIETRKGQWRENTTPLNNGAAFRLHTYYQLDNGTTDYLLVVGDTLYRWNQGNVVSLNAGNNATVYWTAAQLANRVVLCNGVNPNRKWNGSAFYALSIAAPNDPGPAFAAAVGAGGTLAVGSYRYTYTYRNSVTLDESNPVNITNTGFLTASATTTLGNQTVTLSGFVPSADPQVDQIVIYRSVVNTTTPLFEVGTKANAATNFVDNGLADGTHELETDNDVAPLSAISTSFLNRLYLAVGDTLYFSKLNAPGHVPSDNLFRVGRDGQPITCVVPIGTNALFIGKSRSIYLLPGDPVVHGAIPQAFNTQHGVVNARAASVVGYQVFFIDQSLRPHVIDPTELANAERRVHYIGKRLANTFEAVSSTAARHIKCAAVETEDRKEWVVSVPLKSTVETDSFCVYDLAAPNPGGREPGAWTVHDLVPAATLNVLPDRNGIPRLYRGDYRGFLWQSNFTKADGAVLNRTATAGTTTYIEDNGLPDVNGVATAGAVNSITDNTLNMVPNAHVGSQLYISDGPGAGQVRDVLSNTATQLVPTVNFAPAPGPGSVFQVGGLEVNSLLGVPILLTGGPGAGQRSWITANTAKRITFDAVFTAVGNGTLYSVGGIDLQLWTNWKVLTTHEVIKRLWYLWFTLSQFGNYAVTIYVQFDFNTSIADAIALTLTINTATSQWGFFQWGVGVWGGVSSFVKQLGLDRYFHHVRIGIVHKAAAQPVGLNGQSVTFQEKGLFT